MRHRSFALLLILLSGVSGLADAVGSTRISESWGSIKVRAEAPIPEEISNPTQARALSRDAAVSMGQEALLRYVLSKRARSGKPLSEAEIPSLELQNRIRGMIVGVKVGKTRWDNDSCTVDLVLPKSELKNILRRN